MVKVLLAEDNPADVELTREAFRASLPVTAMEVVEDGEEAINYLKRQGKFAEAEQPELIILDINLPKVRGDEVLKIIKAEKSLKQIPVIIMTSSQAPKDITEAYNLHANCFITKPVNVEDFLSIVNKTADFWLHVAKLPPHAT